MEGLQQLPVATTAACTAAVVVVVQTKNQHPVERRCAVYNSVLVMHAAALVCAGEDNIYPEESSPNKRSFGTTPSYSSPDESKQQKRPRRVSNENEDWSPLGYSQLLQPESYHPQDNNLDNEC
jgi:hypothetical protein